jgi:hypothetical protein
MGLQEWLLVMRNCSWVSGSFPNILAEGFNYQDDCKSDRTPNYNCIAWALGKTHQFWWPRDIWGYYWPPGLPREPLNQETVSNFVKAFHAEGYRRCWSGKFHRRYEKIVLYVNDQNRPKHAARLLEAGVWTSKLGKGEDIEHKTLRALEGNGYGKAKFFFKRRLPQWRRNNGLPTRLRSFLSSLLRRVRGKFSPIPKASPTAS